MRGRASRYGVRGILLALSFLIVGALGGCSAAPSADELEGAERARPEGLRVLSSIDVPSFEGWTLAAERRMDACGSLTSDRDWDDAHLEGYSCAAVRRIVYTPADVSGSTDLEDAAYEAIATIKESFAPIVFDQESAWFSVSDTVPTADARFQTDGLDTRIGMVVRTVDAADIDVLPLWHRNNVVHEDDGKLVGKLAANGVSGGSVFVVTVTVTYFEELRDNG